MPGFVKAHGHDHESPIIGIVKDVPLTQWLDGAVNVFTRFLEEEGERLADMLPYSPHLATYLKARVDDIYYGITSCMVHHCGYNKYHVKEIVEANEMAGTRMIVAVGSQDRNFYEKVLDRDPQQVIARLDHYCREYGHLSRSTVIPGPDQFFPTDRSYCGTQRVVSPPQIALIHIHSSEEYNTTQWFKKSTE